MPELPEVELMCRNLTRWTQGKTIVATEGIENETLILHKNIRTCFRRGKYCILPIGSFFVVIHFRMTGKVVLLKENRRFLRRKIRLHDGMEIGILDQRKFSTFEILNEEEFSQRFTILGAEVWPIHRSGQWFQERMGKSRSTLKNLFLRQDIIAGLGNIMCSEVCFRMRCNPQTKAKQLTLHQWDTLGESIHDFVGQVLQEEGGDEIQYVSQGGELPKSFLVYGRTGDPCVECKTPIIQWQMGGRSTYACPSCQRLKE